MASALAHAHGGVDPAAHVDRVGVGQQRAVDAVGARLRDAGTEAGQEEHEDVGGEARRGHHQAEDEGGPADDGRRAGSGRPASPSGTMPRTRKPPEMPATKVMAPVETWNEDWMLGERTASPELCRLSSVTMMARTMKARAPAVRSPSRSDDLLLARSRQHVLGEQDLRHRLGRQLPLGSRIDHQMGQVGRAHVVGGAGTRRASDRRLAHRTPDPRVRPHPARSTHGALRADGWSRSGSLRPSLTQERASRSWGCTCRWSPGPWRRAGSGRTRPRRCRERSAFFSA